MKAHLNSYFMRGVRVEDGQPDKRLLLFHQIALTGGVASFPFVFLYVAAGSRLAAGLVLVYAAAGALMPLLTQRFGPTASRFVWLVTGCALIAVNALIFPAAAEVHYLEICVTIVWLIVFGVENRRLLAIGSLLPIVGFVVVEALSRRALQPPADDATSAIRLSIALTLFLSCSINITYLMVANQRVEAQLRDEKRLLRQEVAERERAEARAVQMSRAKSEFLANMSHELRTPLNAILGYAELLKEDEENPTRTQDLDRIMGAGRHLLDLINNLLSLSKIEAGKMGVLIEEIDVDAELKRVVVTVEPLMKGGNNTLRLAFQAGALGRAFVDRVKLRQILINLVGNAAKFTKDGVITLGAERLFDPPRLQITVEDTGIGISKEAQARLFLPFSQAERSTERDFGGTGLGLSLCFEYCRLLGGSIAVKSDPGKGTAMTVTLPASKPPRVAEDERYEP